jgi:hypothetical protein
MHDYSLIMSNEFEPGKLRIKDQEEEGSNQRIQSDGALVL